MLSSVVNQTRIYSTLQQIPWSSTGISGNQALSPLFTFDPNSVYECEVDVGSLSAGGSNNVVLEVNFPQPFTVFSIDDTVANSIQPFIDHFYIRTDNALRVLQLALSNTAINATLNYRQVSAAVSSRMNMAAIKSMGVQEKIQNTPKSDKIWKGDKDGRKGKKSRFSWRSRKSD